MSDKHNYKTKVNKLAAIHQRRLSALNRASTASSRRRGSILVVVTLSIVALLALSGLVVDGGGMMVARRRAQNAADSAALAGAVALAREGNTATAKTDALQYASDNGFNNNGKDNTVTVSVPPTSGPYKDNTSCVQVSIYKEFPAHFIQIVTRRKPSVVAQAVATFKTGLSGSPEGLICLNSGKGAALSMADNSSLQVTGGGVMVNSNASNALNVMQRGTINAERVRVTGGAAVAPNASVAPAPLTGVPPVADPLAYLPAPDPQTLGLQTYPGIDTTSATSIAPMYLRPGVYQGGIKLLDTPAILEPGIYIMDGGGLQLSGTASMTGLGVMFYNTSYNNPPGPIRLSGSGQLNVSAPATGVYKDILFFQDRANGSGAELKAGGNITALSGTFYMPKANYTLIGQGATIDLLATQFIVDSMTMTGDGSLRIRFDGNSSTAGKEVTLIE